MKIKSVTDLLRFNRTKDRLDKQQALTAISEYNISEESAGKHSHFYTSEAQETTPDKYYHLLSEGVILYSDGTPMDIVAKGAIKNWYDSLSDTDVYDIDLQHDMSNPLFRQIGTWSKSDLKLEQDADGRYSVYVKLNLDEDSIVVKELKRKSSYIGLSAEFNSDGKFVDFTHPEGSDIVFVHEAIDIIGFGIVGEPADAKSGNVTLNAVEAKEEPKEEPKTEVEEEPKTEVKEELKEEAKEEAKVEAEASSYTLEAVMNKLLEIEKQQTEASPLEEISTILDSLGKQGDAIEALTNRVDSITSFSVGNNTNTKTPARKVGF